MRTSVAIIIILVISMLGLPRGIVYGDIEADDQLPVPKFEMIDGNEISPGIYEQGSNVTISYSTSIDTSMYLLVNGSGQSDDTIVMEYQRFENGKYFYITEISIRNYTTYVGYTKTEGQLQYEEFDTEVGIQLHRIWTIHDQPPEFETVVGDEINQLNDVATEHKINGNTTITYVSESITNKTVKLLIGEDRYNLSQTESMKYTGNGLYQFNISLNSRELWFTAFSDRSFEINRDSITSYNLHRITNGIAINSTKLYANRNGTIIDNITDRDRLTLNVTTINETGNELLTTQVSVDENITSYDYETMTTQTIGSTLVKQYQFDLGHYQSRDRLTIEVLLSDDENSTILVDTVDTTVIIARYGAIIEIDHYDRYTTNAEMEIGFSVTSSDVELESISLVINDTNTQLDLADRRVNITLEQGNNSISIVVVNELNETSVETVYIVYDTVLPEIENLHVTADGNLYRVRGSVSEQISGLSRLLVTVNNLTREIPITDIYDMVIDFPLELSHGVNTIEISATDRAGNVGIMEIEYLVQTEDSTAGFLSIWSIISVIAVITILITRRRLR